MAEPEREGLDFEAIRESESRPPLAGQEGQEGGGGVMGEPESLEPGAFGPAAKAGKVPLHPAVIRLPCSILGRVGSELTGYPGFVFTQQELDDLAALWEQTGVQMNPMTQAAIGTTAMIGGKVLGYFAWVKAGKPGIPGAKDIGEGTIEKEAHGAQGAG